VLIGGAYDGKNSISFTTKVLPGAKGTEPMDIRIFLMSKIPEGNPVPVFQYRITPEDIKAGKRPAASAQSTFNVTPEHVKSIVLRKQQP